LPDIAEITELISKEFEHLRDVLDPFSFLAEGLNDTSLVMVATSLIDEMMKLTLVCQFAPMNISKRLLSAAFDGTGPLATFSAKTTVCLALGLLEGDARHDISIIRTIRNEFAHSCKERHLSEFSEWRSLKATTPTPEITDASPERAKFKTSCAAIILHLLMALIVKTAIHNITVTYKDEITSKAKEMLRDVQSIRRLLTPTPTG
jgi:DNA-binding MltR family transcriptional regulator